ncbi:hypothetical protein HHI36_022699 [Cryptolaemus montrouzieri]|uniref:Dynein heavy chain coiled coil stalk domain-containing protein n=1 Tax=Cryptolaemus montrouzieri TaxID=559131 RepID=A0ABD2N1D4_9CUCU
MAAVCVIKDVKPDRIPDPSTGRKLIDYWGPSKRILGDMNFLQSLKDFDKDHIKTEIMVKIRKDYLPHKDFKPHVVAKASSAAEVMAAVCVIKDVKPDRISDPSTGRKLINYWGPSKRILGDMNFLQSLKDFDKDHIKTEIMVKIRKDYLPHKDFKPHVVAKASSAAEGE